MHSLPTFEAHTFAQKRNHGHPLMDDG
jgi:hypothetical protein